MHSIEWRILNIKSIPSISTINKIEALEVILLLHIEDELRETNEQILRTVQVYNNKVQEVYLGVLKCIKESNDTREYCSNKKEKQKNGRIKTKKMEE